MDTNERGDSFETALAELEKLVKKLEGGEGTLDEALADFERATALVRLCNDRLTSAEKRIEIITGEEIQG